MNAMNYAKLDAALQELLAESELDETPLESVLVAVVIADDAAAADRKRLESALHRPLPFGTVAVGELTSDGLAEVSENPAVVAVQLSRRLRPKIRRQAG